jgi:hypothetical protein
MNSVMALVSMPPPRMRSSSLEPVVHLIISLLLWRTSIAETKPGPIFIRARRFTLTVVSAPSPAFSASSRAGVAATASRVV